MTQLTPWLLSQKQPQILAYSIPLYKLAELTAQEALVLNEILEKLEIEAS